MVEGRNWWKFRNKQPIEREEGKSRSELENTFDRRLLRTAPELATQIAMSSLLPPNTHQIKLMQFMKKAGH